MSANNLIKNWQLISEYLSVPRDGKAYNKLVNLLDTLVDEIGNDEKNPAAALMETIGLLIAEYEKIHHIIKKSSGIDVLKDLMAEHDIKQSNLKEIGSQGIVSEILNGKRSLNIRQVKLLASRFNVSPDVFI